MASCMVLEKMKYIVCNKQVISRNMGPLCTVSEKGRCTNYTVRKWLSSSGIGLYLNRFK